jgi:hypothetical protein
MFLVKKMMAVMFGNGLKRIATKMNAGRQNARDCLFNTKTTSFYDYAQNEIV